MKKKTDKERGKELLVRWATTHGYRLDRWGNLVKQFDTIGKTIRFKMNPNKVRKETKVAGVWKRVSSASYKDLFITDDDKIGGFKRF